MLLSAPVVLCFLYFMVFAAGLTGLQSFGVSSMVEQYGVAATAASSALTAYLVAAAIGIVAGGVVASHDAARFRRRLRHGGERGRGACDRAACVARRCPTGGTRDRGLRVRRGGALARPHRARVDAAGAAGRVFGFVYSDSTWAPLRRPCSTGCCSTALPHAVFYTVFAFTFAAMLTVLLLRVTNTLPVQHPQ